MVGLKDPYTTKSLTLNTSEYSPPNPCALSSLCLLSVCLPAFVCLFVCLFVCILSCVEDLTTGSIVYHAKFGFQLKFGRHCSLIWCPANWMLPVELSPSPCVSMWLPFSALPWTRTYQNTSRSTPNGETVWNTGWTFKNCSSGRSLQPNNQKVIEMNRPGQLLRQKVITMVLIPGLSATEWQLSQLLWLQPCSFRPDKDAAECGGRTRGLDQRKTMNKLLNNTFAGMSHLGNVQAKTSHHNIDFLYILLSSEQKITGTFYDFPTICNRPIRSSIASL